MTLCHDVQLALGAFALGALDPEEAARVRRHLDDCPACAEEADALRHTAGALSLVDAGDGPAVSEETSEDPPSGGLLPGLLQAVADQRRARGRRLRLGLAAAAVAMVLAAVGGVVAGSQLSDGQPPAVAGEDRSGWLVGTQGDVRLEIDAQPRAWGSAVRASVSGVSPGSRCDLVAVGHDDSRMVAASWLVPSGGYARGPLQVDGAVGMKPDQVARYEVVTRAGAVLVTAPS